MRALVTLLALLLACSAPSLAGGPLIIGGPQLGREGEPFRWNPATMPIRYRVDTGPLSRTIDNAQARALVESMFQVWQSVPTATISYSYAGPVLGNDGQPLPDVSTVEQFNQLMGMCRRGEQSPIIFDADGKLTEALGIDGAIGFTAPCQPASATESYFVGAAVVMNGKFIDGDSANNEIPDFVFNTAMTHEFGHFSGLGHSQVNVSNLDTFTCSDDLQVGLPLMYPVLACPPILNSSDLPVLAADDLAALSFLYPNAQTPLTYGTLRGHIFFSDALSPVQGVNVVARRADDPNTPEEDESLRIAVSAVSGARFTSNPGQTLTGDNLGSIAGSRKADLIGHFEMLVPAGTYTIEVESIFERFRGGSAVGPLSPPVPVPGGTREFWNKDESAFDFPAQRDTITVHPGQFIEDLDIILNFTPPRFDYYDGGAQLKKYELWIAQAEEA